MSRLKVSVSLLAIVLVASGRAHAQPTPADPTPSAAGVMQPHKVVEAYLSAALRGDSEGALALAEPGSSVATEKTVDELREVLDAKPAGVAAVAISEESGVAMVQTTTVKLKKPQPDGQDIPVSCRNRVGWP